MFGAELGRHHRREDAVEQVLTEGLASLAERWTLRHRDGDVDYIYFATPYPLVRVRANADDWLKIGE